MTIIIGLGNPGKKFENTRHNVGFMAIDNFVKINNFPDFILQKKYDAEISEGEILGEKILLAKPQTFMNESGKSVKKILSKNNSENIIIIHDDIDLPIGKIKIAKDRGSAGHKGVESIIQNIGNENLIRIRVGIGTKNKQEAIKIVLKNFSTEEKFAIDDAIKKASEALNLFIKEGLEKAMNEFNNE